MDKTSYRVLTLTVGCMLLLSVTAEQAFAWPCPPCPPCYTCLPTGCDYDCYAGKICCGGGCASGIYCDCCNDQLCCNYGDSCCTDSGAGDVYCCIGSKTCCDRACCDPSTQKCCDDIGGDDDGYCCDSNETCCDGNCCDPDYCQECVNDQCLVCGGRPGEFCCDGTCCDAETKCCDNGTCVPKCTNTDQCDYDEPPGSYVECYNHPVTGKCEELEGGLCGHFRTIAVNDANCADCAPGCNKTRISACADITPYYCRTHCYLWVCTCLCDADPDGYYTVGDHYECPN